MVSEDNGFEQADVFCKDTDGVCQYRIPALLTTNKGTLLAVSDARVHKPGDAPNKINLAMKRSSDGGRSWSAMKYIAQFGEGEAACDPCMLVDRDTGRIWLVYDYAVPCPGQPHDRSMKFHLIRSDDEGETWSAPLDLTATLVRPEWRTIQAAPGRGIQLRNGTLVFPIYTLQQDLTFRCHLLRSADHGGAWNIGSPVGENRSEPQIVELLDGSIKINMRQAKAKGCRSVAVTHDVGETWSVPQDDRALVDPGCQACIHRLTDSRDGDDKSRLLFSNAAHPTTRLNMTLRLSYDEGKTWPVSRLLHTERSMYSCLTTLPDRTIGLLYEKDLNIAFARITLAWLTDGA